MRCPFHRINVEGLIHVFAFNTRLALFPVFPVIRLVMNRAVYRVHVITDMFHDVDLAGIWPGITGRAALPVIVLFAGR